MYCHVLRDGAGAVLALEIIYEPTRAAYGRFSATADLASLDVDVEPNLLKLLALRQSSIRSDLKVEIYGGKATLVSGSGTSVSEVTGQTRTI